MRRDRLTLHFDGGCRPDAGMATAVVVNGTVHLRDHLGPGDSCEAEWLALRHAAELALAAGAEDVVFVGDSETVIRQASGEWRCRSAQLLPHLLAYRAAIAGIGHVHVRRVRRWRNLAGIALDAQRR